MRRIEKREKRKKGEGKKRRRTRSRVSKNRRLRRGGDCLVCANPTHEYLYPAGRQK